MNKQELAAKIWESANKMRSKIEANEYKDYILGFIFYKYLSDKVVSFLRSQGGTREDIRALSEEDASTRSYIQRNIGYFIAYEHLFSTWLEKGKDFDVAHVREALSAFRRLIAPQYARVFDGIFETLDAGLSKLGDTAGSQTKAINDLIQLIKDIPMDGKQDYDVLGFIYEYLIEKFASNAGKKAGEFYTPHEVSLLMSEMIAEALKDREEIQIYDPTSGSGSLLINIGRSVSKHIDNDDNIKYYAQELKENTYNLTRMNLVMRGILPSNITTRRGDTLEEDWPYFDEKDPIGTYEPLYVDAVVSNPPYSQAWDPTDKASDPRFAGFGLAPRGKADYAFLLHDLYHLKQDGIMTIVLPHGVLFRGGEEGVIRKNLIESNHIDTIIGLPANIFYGTGIPTIIMVLKKQRQDNKLLIIDASKGFKKKGKSNVLRASDIKRIVDAVQNRQDIPKFANLVDREVLRENDYNLNIPRYVDSSEPLETWDLYASMHGGIPENELAALQVYWDAFPGLKEALFEKTSPSHAKLVEGAVAEMIRKHPSVQAFKKQYQEAFDGHAQELHEHLIQGMEELRVHRTEEVLSEDVFDRLGSIPLIDPYEAYELLHEIWVDIRSDIEVIQIDGRKKITEVKPRIVLKKKAGRETEVQEGWMGTIFPFDLIQRTFLQEAKQSLDHKEDDLAEIASTKEEIFESLSEEDKEDLKEALNDDNTNFRIGETKKLVRLFKKESTSYDEDSAEAKAMAFVAEHDKETKLKREIKKEAKTLHLATKECIEGLTDEMIETVLTAKWIKPIQEALKALPVKTLDVLEEKIEDLSQKYEETLKDIDEEIEKTEKELVGMLKDLTGNEADMAGIEELIKLLGGSIHD